MILTETIPTNLFANRLAQIHHDIEGLNAIATQLKTKQQKLTQLFHQASSALNVVSQLTILVPQTSREIKAILEAIFQPEKSEKPLNSDDDGQTVSQGLMQVASQLVPTFEFTPAPSGGNNPWRPIGNIANWSYDAQEKSFLLTAASSNSLQIKIYILGHSSFRVRFNPNSTDYSKNLSNAVVNRNLGNTSINYAQNSTGSSLTITLDEITISVGLQPYGIAVHRGSQLVHETSYDYNLVYIPFGSEVTACFMNVAPGAGYYGFGEKAGININNNFHTTTFFNYDNFQYDGSNSADGDNYPVIPSNSQPGPLNIEEPLYNSMSVLVEWNPAPSGDFAGSAYANLIFLDNPCQTYFNIQTNDYSQYMDGKYYFGSLYNEMDYYFMTGSDIASVLDQFNVLTGPSPMPPMYALGYHQGGYGYYNSDRLLSMAKSYRDNQIPIDGLHIDVDFQNNYRTFTSSQEKFGNVNDLFNQLHGMGFKCSTNITGIMTIVPWDESAKTNDSTPAYPAVN